MTGACACRPPPARQASDIKVEAERILSVRDSIVGYYAQLSGQPREKVIIRLPRRHRGSVVLLLFHH